MQLKFKNGEITKENVRNIFITWEKSDKNTKLNCETEGFSKTYCTFSLTVFLNGPVLIFWGFYQPHPLPVNCTHMVFNIRAFLTPPFIDNPFLLLSTTVTILQSIQN